MGLLRGHLTVPSYARKNGCKIFFEKAGRGGGAPFERN